MQRMFSLKFFPWLILYLGLALTFGLWRSYQTNARQALEVEFHIISDQLTEAIAQHLQSNEQVLRGVVGLFNSSQDVSREEFRAYVEALHLEDLFPGIQGVAFSQLIQPSALAAHVDEMRAQGHINYVIRPEGVRDVYSSIVYIEPFSGRNLRAFGYDMFAEPVRQAAMQRARDEGVAAMSGKVTLVQETSEDVQRGFLLYLPVYRSNLPRTTLEERRSNLLGWAYSPLRINDMINGALGQVDFAGTRSLTDFEIFAAERPSENSLIFDSDSRLSLILAPSGEFASERQIKYGGTVWTLRFFSSPRFDARLDQSQALYIALTGSALSLLLALIALAQRRVVEALHRTAEANLALSQSKDSYQTLFSGMTEGVFYQQADGLITDVNSAALELYGISRDELLGCTAINPAWHMVNETGELLAPENHPAMLALRTGEVVVNKVLGVFNPRRSAIVWLGVNATPLFAAGQSVPHQVFVTMFDLSEQKAAEEALRQSEHRLRDMVENLPAGAVHRTDEGLWINAKAESITGYSRAELCTIEAWFSNLYGERASTLREYYEADRLAGFSESRTALIRRKDGVERWVEFLVYCYAGGDVWLLNDLTERRQTEERLKLVDFALDHVNVAAYLADRNGTLHYVNQAACDTLKHSRDALLNLKLWDVDATVSGTLTDWQARFADFEQQGSVCIESLHKTSAGELIPVEVRANCFVLGEAHFVLGLATDITVRKQVEEKLLVMVAAIEQSSNAIEITDTDAVIEYVNPSFLKTSGRTREQVIGQNPRIFASGETPQATYEAMWRKLSEGQPWSGEFINRRPDGEVYVEHANISPIRQKNGRISHFIAIKDDVTEQRRIEAELKRYREHLEELVEARTADLSVAKEAAEAASRAKSTFLATMSHELRTPMNAIIGLSHILSRKSADAEQRDKLGKINASANDLLKILSNVLDLSKIDAERMTIDPVPFSLISVFSNIDTLLGQEAQAKGLLLGWEIPPEYLGLQLFGDAMKLQQVLLELISNGIKFTANGGVSLSVNVQDVREKILMVRFSVADTGIGIAREDWPRLFNPFEQLDGSMTRRFGGTGLGLALAKRIVQLLGGEIGLESVPGQGATFWFTAKFERLDEGKAKSADLRTESRELLLARLEALRELLVQDEISASAAYLSLKPSIDCLVGSAAEHLGRQIEDFAFDEAQITLEEVMRIIRRMPTTH
ncbi:MAG: CHASE domain-containing protein [Rhodocyclaceae bacterium]|nr:CHASE domain-containing protein [Rhodocyclaceae bacterium]